MIELEGVRGVDVRACAVSTCALERFVDQASVTIADRRGLQRWRVARTNIIHAAGQLAPSGGRP